MGLIALLVIFFFLKGYHKAKYNEAWDVSNSRFEYIGDSGIYLIAALFWPIFFPCWLIYVLARMVINIGKYFGGG